jgi:hypothetical protein
VIFRQPTLKQSAIIAQNLLLAAPFLMSNEINGKEMLHDIFELITKYCPTSDYENYGNYMNKIVEILVQDSKTSST